MKFLRYMLLAGLLGSGVVHSASFDCDQGRTRVEKLICSHEQLSDLDEKLSSAYRDAKNQTQPPETNRLTQEQIRWMRNVRNRCSDEPCLEAAYKARLNDLDPFADGKLTCEEMRRWPARIFEGGSIDLGSGHGSPTDVDYGCPDSLNQLPFMAKLLKMAEHIRSQDAPSHCTGSIVHAQWRLLTTVHN